MFRALILLLTLLFVCPVGAEEPSREQVLKSIARYKVDPLSPYGRELGRSLMAYSIDSPDVLIGISETVLPFMEEKLPEADVRSLISAYTIGNMEPQLKSKKKQDHPYEGVLLMLRVYRQMKLTDPQLNSPSLEHLAELESNGRLRAAVSKHGGKPTR